MQHVALMRPLLKDEANVRAHSQSGDALARGYGRQIGRHLAGYNRLLRARFGLCAGVRPRISTHPRAPSPRSRAAWGLIGRRPSETDSTAWPGATGFEPLHSWRPQHHHCPFGSASVEVPGGCEVASNRLASITKLASMLTTETRNGNSMRVPEEDHRACESWRAQCRSPM
jgi:hypothetical protein